MPSNPTGMAGRDGLAMQTLSIILANGLTSSTHISVSAALEISRYVF